MTDKYWKTNEEIYIGVPIGEAIELTKVEFEAIQQEQYIISVKSKRDSLIADIEWRRSRYKDEVLLGLTPTELLLPILEYIQALRDITSQEGFPSSISWPTIGD